MALGDARRWSSTVESVNDEDLLIFSSRARRPETGRLWVFIEGEYYYGVCRRARDDGARRLHSQHHCYVMGVGFMSSHILFGRQSYAPRVSVFFWTPHQPGSHRRNATQEEAFCVFLKVVCSPPTTVSTATPFGAGYKKKHFNVLHAPVHYTTQTAAPSPPPAPASTSCIKTRNTERSPHE